MTDPKDPSSTAPIPPTRFSTSGAERAAPAGRQRGRLVLAWLALVIAAGAVAGGLVLNRKIDRFERAMSDHQQSGDRTAMATQLQSNQAFQGVQQTDRRISQLEGKLADAQNQQQALQMMYQDLARNRAQWTLAEVGQMLSSASQQLQLTGNVQLALFALQSADARLALAEGPQMLAVRKALAQDIDKLKATPSVDLPGLAIKLDDAIARIDALPLAGEAPYTAGTAGATGTTVASGTTGVNTAPSADASSTAAPASSAASGPVASVLDRAGAWWRDFGERLGHQLASVIQVRRIDNADAMLVAPDQAQYLRANLKLRLLQARLSLLSRDEKTMDADLDAADTALARYFDPASKSVQTVRDLVSQVRHTSMSVELPNLNTSLEAVHQYKSGD
jgi:uroporphyrinogen III methyltransferase / synthase